MSDDEALNDEPVGEEMDEELDGEGPTDAERTAIASHFLMNAPPGEFDAVLGDVRALMPAGTLTDAM